MICPENFGCSGKLGFSDTRALVRDAGFEPVGDYSLSESGRAAMTIDRVGQCAKNPRQFAEIALAHACRDLEAAGVRPADALICYEFGPEIEGNERVALVRSVREAAERRGISIGKCHTVLVEGPTALILSVSGGPLPGPITVADAGLVWLSHGLGAAKLHYMSELGTLAEPSSHFQLMVSEVDRRPFSGTGTTLSDVSGHGLAGTLVDLAERHGLQVTVVLSDAQAVSPAVLSEEITLFENDSASYSPFITLEDGARTLALLKETAGPLVALTSLLNENAITAIVDAGWKHIGEFQKGRAAVDVQWRG